MTIELEDLEPGAVYEVRHFGFSHAVHVGGGKFLGIGPDGELIEQMHHEASAIEGNVWPQKFSMWAPKDTAEMKTLLAGLERGEVE